MKKILLVLLSLILAATLVSCSNTESKQEQLLNGFSEFLDNEGFVSGISQKQFVEEVLAKYTYKGEKITDIAMTEQYDGIGGGGWKADDNIFTAKNELWDDVYSSTLHTVDRLDGLVIPFGIEFDDETPEVFKKLKVNDMNNFVPEDGVNKSMTLIKSDEKTLKVFDLKDKPKESNGYDSYGFEIKFTENTDRQLNNKPVKVERYVSFFFDADTSRLSGFDLGVNENRSCFEFTECENGYSIRGIKDSVSGDIVIPSNYKGKPVVAIQSRGFENSNITSVIIPPTVKTIGGLAFAECISLTDVEISNGVEKIDHQAFNHCYSLVSIDLPDSVEEIEIDAFNGSLALQEINVSGGNEKFFSDDGVLYSNDMHSLIICPNGKTEVKIPKGILSIGDYAFESCVKLTTIEFPDTLTDIGNGSFEACISLKQAIIPESVKRIGNDAFSDCHALESATVPAGVETMGGYVFYSCPEYCVIKIASENIPDGWSKAWCTRFKGKIEWGK